MEFDIDISCENIFNLGKKSNYYKGQNISSSSLSPRYLLSGHAGLLSFSGGKL